MDPVRRLMFWLRVPFVADAGLAVIGIALLAGGDGVGWWVLMFAGLRAIVGVVAIVWIAPRMIARLAAPADHPAAPSAARPGDPPGAADPAADATTRSSDPPVDRLDT